MPFGTFTSHHTGDTSWPSRLVSTTQNVRHMAVQGSLGITLNYQCRSGAYVPFLSFVELIWNHPKTFTLVGLKVVVATSGTAVISLRSVGAFGYPRHQNIDRTWVLARGTSAKIFPSSCEFGRPL